MSPRSISAKHTEFEKDFYRNDYFNSNGMSSCLGTNNYSSMTPNSIAPSSNSQSDSDQHSVDAFLNEILQTVHVNDDTNSTLPSSSGSPVGAASTIKSIKTLPTNSQHFSGFEFGRENQDIKKTHFELTRNSDNTSSHFNISRNNFELPRIANQEFELPGNNPDLSYNLTYELGGNNQNFNPFDLKENSNNSTRTKYEDSFSQMNRGDANSSNLIHLGLCEIHREAKIFFCETCLCSACGICASNDHRAHLIMYVQEFLPKVRTACLCLVAEARSGAQIVKDSLELGQQIAESVENRANRAANDIRATIRRFVAAIEERQRELIGRVERARQLKGRTLLMQMDGLRMALSHIARTIDVLGEALENASPIELLEKSERANIELRKLRALQMSLMPTENDFIMYTPPDPSLWRSVATMGCVQASSVAVELGATAETVPVISMPLPPLPLAPRGRPIFGLNESVTIRSPDCQPVIFGGEGDTIGKLCRPWGICSDRNGNILVADRSNNRIQVFRSNGIFLFTFGSHGNLPGQLDRPAGICCDAYGRIVVVDKDNHRVQIFMSDGTFILSFGEKGCKNGQFNYPWDVASNAQSQLVVADTRNHRIQLFGPDGTFLAKYGFEGASPMWKHFDSPRGICFSSDGQVLVTDFNNHRLIVIDSGFIQARYLGGEGTGDRQFLRPQGVICDDEGNFAVADSRNNRIQVFDKNGLLLWKLGSGPGKGPTEIDRPSGICLTVDGRIAVVDFGNHRVIIF